MPGYKLIDGRAPRGRNLHRHGWPSVFEALKANESPGGILLDDFIEQTFSRPPRGTNAREPWIGIFHHPQDNPQSRDPISSIQNMFLSGHFQQALPSMRAAIALSDHLGDYLRQEFDFPVHVLRYPSPEIPWRDQWDRGFFAANPMKCLAQVGWFLRNTQAIYQIPPQKNWMFRRYWPKNRWIHGWDDSVAANWYREGTRPRYSGVDQWPLLPNSEYDDMLASSVVLNEIVAASANTVLVECIARNTPIIINRYPSVVEYLGEDYPLYFDDIQEVPDLLNLDRIIAAHLYLVSMNKDWLSLEKFVQSIQDICNDHSISRPAQDAVTAPAICGRTLP